MTLALCPGSFDPVTNGHLDIIERACSHFDEVLVAVIANPGKSPLFTLEEREAMLRESLGRFDNVTIDSFQGLLVEFARQRHVDVIVKGLRAVTDFDYEIQMAQMNQRIGGIDTYFLPTRTDWSYLSSSLVREVARHGGDVRGLVPDHVLHELNTRYGR